MVNDEQKRIWQQEKAQQLIDTQQKPRQVIKKPKALSFGGTKKRNSKEIPNYKSPGSVTDNSANDSYLRGQLGI